MRFDAHATAVGRGSRHVLGCLPVSEAAACVLRLAVAPPLGGGGDARGSGGTKFVLHALRVLVQQQQQPAAKEPRQPGACDASLPRYMHSYMEGNSYGSRGK